MALHPCAEPGCPTITDQRRCPAHTRELDRARGTRQQRGYDAGHDALRAHWDPIVQTGCVACARCGRLIHPGTAWHLDHDDDRTGYRGPSHWRCNLSAAGSTAHGL